MAVKKPTPPAKKAPAKPAAPAKKPTAPAKPAAPAKKAAPVPAKPAAPAKKAAPAKATEKKAPKAAPPEDDDSLKSALLEASGVEPQGDDESDEDFQVRIATALSEMPEKDYKKVSAEVKAWFNAAVDAINEDKLDQLPGFGASAEASEEAAEEDAEEGGEEEAAEPEAKPAKKADAKPAKKAAKEEDAEAPRSSGSSIARVIVCEQPDLSLADLKAELKRQGVKITDSQVHAVHNMTTRVLKVLKQLGKLK